jgi:DNA-binding NarL/FixJ family response regulator
MTRVLFVDDEASILSGLRNVLRKHRSRFDMQFALGGEQALAAMSAEPADVVVSDMRMPGMDGATLLEQIKARYPKAVRFVLTGHAERSSLFRAFPVAHRILYKPCDPELLPIAIERACRLRASLGRSELAPLESVRTQIQTPTLYWQLTAALAKPNVDWNAVAALFDADATQTLLWLSIARARVFGLPRDATVAGALAHLGLDVAQSLALCAHAWSCCVANPKKLARALVTATVAQHIGAEGCLAHECFSAAMLRDLGQCVIAKRYPELEADLALRWERGEPEPERATLGFTHADAGAWLLDAWGLGNGLVEAAATHHGPANLGQPRVDLAACVNIAEALTSPMGELDVPWLESMGVAAHLSEWRAYADEELKRAGF